MKKYIFILLIIANLNAMSQEKFQVGFGFPLTNLNDNEGLGYVEFNYNPFHINHFSFGAELNCMVHRSVDIRISLIDLAPATISTWNYFTLFSGIETKYNIPIDDKQFSLGLSFGYNFMDNFESLNSHGWYFSPSACIYIIKSEALNVGIDYTNYTVYSQTLSDTRVNRDVYTKPITINSIGIVIGF